MVEDERFEAIGVEIRKLRTRVSALEERNGVQIGIAEQSTHRPVMEPETDEIKKLRAQLDEARKVTESYKRVAEARATERDEARRELAMLQGEIDHE